MPVLAREFDELLKELDPNNSGKVNYDLFLSQVYLAKMYCQESQLLDLLKRSDPDNKGGVNIAQM